MGNGDEDESMENRKKVCKMIQYSPDEKLRYICIRKISYLCIILKT